MLFSRPMISLLYYRWLQEKKSRWTHKMPLCHVLPRQLAADGPFHASVLHFLLKTPIWRAYFSRRRDRKNYQLLLCCSSGPPQKLMAWDRVECVFFRQSSVFEIDMIRKWLLQFQFCDHNSQWVI
jgi:hypothetical protein